jgi:hypothetical protein
LKAVILPPEDRLLGAGLFAAPGVIGASFRYASGLSGVKRSWLEGLVTSARNDLPMVVVLAVSDMGVRAIAADLRGTTHGEEVAFWPRNGFSATVQKKVGLLQLEMEGAGHHVRLECKYVPFGPNRFNRQVTELVLQASETVSIHAASSPGTASKAQTYSSRRRRRRTGSELFYRRQH